jgi:hypothetical protein
MLFASSAGFSIEDGSPGSRPAIAESTVAQSRASRVIGPTLSSVHESAIAPFRLTTPYVGRKPVTPQNDDGHVIEPHVSEPIANGTIPDATAEPEPDDDPPDQRPRSHGVAQPPVSEESGHS